MKIKHLSLVAFAATAIITTSCKKEAATSGTPAVDPSQLDKQALLSDVSTNVIMATYNDMEVKANGLYNALVSFSNTSTASNLNNAQQAWRDIRSAWEQSEGFLFGPVSVANIDPRVDTWPIDYARIDSILNTTTPLTPTYVDGLEESLKGFHPLEYLMWGTNGNKTAASFTNREKEFLMALADNLKTLCIQLNNDWKTSGANYHNSFVTAGNGSTVYATQRAAYEEIIDAMAGICDEVANGKMGEPFTTQDASLEESPYAKNSLNDFTNNMRSVQNIYLGKYITDGKGLEDLIKANNISMDGQIKTKINNTINGLNNITVPFGNAISTQQTQVQNAINAINDLKSYLENNVKPFVQTLVN